MTEVRLVLCAAGSHLYPGARGTASGEAPPAESPPAETPCLVEFADGAATPATLAPAAGGCLLATAPYTTARGTRIPAKRWLVSLAPGTDGPRFRVLRRAGSPPPASRPYVRTSGPSRPVRSRIPAISSAAAITPASASCGSRAWRPVSGSKRSR